MAFDYRNGILAYQIAGDDRPPREIIAELRADELGGNEINRVLLQAEELRALVDKRIAAALRMVCTECARPAREHTGAHAFTLKQPARPTVQGVGCRHVPIGVLQACAVCRRRGG